MGKRVLRYEESPKVKLKPKPKSDPDVDVVEIPRGVEGDIPRPSGRKIKADKQPGCVSGKADKQPGGVSGDASMADWLRRVTGYEQR